MFDNAGRNVAASNPLPPHVPIVEFYTIELSSLADGMIGVSLQATTFDEVEFQLSNQELGANRVPTIDDALAFVKASVLFA